RRGLGVLHAGLDALVRRRRHTEEPCASGRLENHAVVALRRLFRHHAFAHVGQHAFWIARERIAMSAAAWGVQPEEVAGPQWIIGVARGQALRRRGVRVDPDIAGAAAAAAGAAARRNRMPHRADRKARIGEVEVFAADAEPTAKLARAAGIGDQFEAGDTRWEFAFDDLDRRDLGIALIDGDAGRSVLGRARSGAAGDDLV